MEIRIESILGGHMPTTHFGSKGQFRASLGIDPAQPIDDNDTAYSTIASGLIRPTPSQAVTTSINAAPLWQRVNPKDSNLYVLDALGSMYSWNPETSTFTGLSDGGSLSNGIGNGFEYYDNYIYISKNTTIARYGPLNGTPAFNGDYWVGTLGKTALANTTYPSDDKANIQYPNHYLHRDTNGKLYIVDVVGNRGTLHFIQTSKTTVEGDTDNGSTYANLSLGYGYWPTCVETYGSDLAIALYEGSNASNIRQSRAKVVFWDKTSTNYNKLIEREFPDAIITAMENVNGVLMVVSGNYKSTGYRVSRFAGGYSWEELGYVETGQPCFPDAIDAQLMRTLIGSFTTVPESDGCVYSYGLQKKELSSGFFNVMRATGGNSSTVVTSVKVVENLNMNFLVPSIGWTKGSGTGNNGLDSQGSQYNNAPQVWWSEMFRIGMPFSIDKIHIPLCQAIAAGMILDIKIWVDDGQGSFTGTSVGLPTINNTTYPNGEKNINLFTQNIRGENNFWVELRWTGSTLLTPQLPIVIDVTPIPD